MKTLTLKVSKNVQIIIRTLSRMSIQKTNIIFFRTSIIFFSDARNVIFKFIFRENIIFALFDRRLVSYLQEKEIPSLPNIQKTSYFHNYFEKHHPSFSVYKRNIILSGKRNAIFPDNTRKIIFQCDFLGKTIFSEHLKKMLYFHIFFWERSSLIFHIKNKIIFSGKRNTIFPDDTEKIIFQQDFFEKTIFFRTFGLRKYVFCVQCIC